MRQLVPELVSQLVADPVPNFCDVFFRSHIDLIAIVRLGCTLDALSETDTRWPAHANSFRVARPHWRTLPTSWSNRPRPCGANLYGAGIAWLRRVKQTLDRGPGSHGIGKPGWELMECSLNAPPTPPPGIGQMEKHTSMDQIINPTALTTWSSLSVQPEY